MQKFTLIFSDVEQVHLGKDVFLFPYYLGKRYNMEVHIVYPQTSTNTILPAVYRGVYFHPILCDLNYRYDFETYRSYLSEHAREIDLLMLFHRTDATEKLCILYKRKNPHGKCYVKLDACPEMIPLITRFRKNFIKQAPEIIQARRFCSKVDYVSIETSATYNSILHSSNIHYAFKNKLHLHRNGFDEEMLQEMNIAVRDFSQKENLFITVGRLGTLQKNTPMLLEATKLISLKDWKVILIGPIEPEFMSEVQRFFEERPDLKDKVIFTDEISDKKELFEYYNRAKVFCLTSDNESFGLVITEAYRFKNYILSTPVGAYVDVVQSNNVGESIPLRDYQTLAYSMQNIIDGKVDIDVYKDDDVCLRYNMNRIAEEFEIF